MSADSRAHGAPAPSAAQVSIPVASGWLDATMPSVPSTGERYESNVRASGPTRSGRAAAVEAGAGARDRQAMVLRELHCASPVLGPRK